MTVSTEDAAGNTPRQLLAEKRWTPRKGKVPYDARSRRKANTTATLCTYTEAGVSWADGRGFMLGDGYACVDLDHCRDATTGELTAEAEAIVSALDSYTEVSLSGEGLHIFIRAAPGKAVKTPGVEVYREKRHIAFTGDHLAGTPTDVNEREEEIAALIQRLRPGTSAAPSAVKVVGLVLNAEAKAPDSVMRLIAGNQTLRNTWNFARKELGDDRSRYDMALAGFLVNAGCTDQEIADTIIEFRHRHNLDPAKAMRPDYIPRTIEAARSEATRGPLEQLPFSVTRFVQLGTDEPSYDLVVRDRTTGAEQTITFSETAQLRSPRRVADRLFAAGYVLPSSLQRRDAWERVLSSLLPLKEVEETATEIEIWQSILTRWLNHSVVMRFNSKEASITEATREQKMPSFMFTFALDQDGTVWLRAESLVHWVKMMDIDSRATVVRATTMLRRLGFTKALLRIGDDRRKVNIWESPRGFAEDVIENLVDDDESTVVPIRGRRAASAST